MSTQKEQEVPIFFIVGRPRSGTTLLRTLLDAHPNVIVPPECQFIINLYPKYGRITSWKKKHLEGFYKEVLSQWLFDLWPLDKEQLLQGLIACEGENTYSHICKTVYSCYQSVFEHDEIMALGDKNPGYTIYTEKLLRIFPEAKFIHIIRDYRDNFVSIKNVDFELPYISLTTAKWKIFHKKFRKTAIQYPGTHLELRYEDLVANPELEFKAVCSFLEIPFSNKALSFHEKGEAATEMYPKEILEKYQSSLFKKIDSSKVGIWKKKLKESDIRSADAVAGKYAELAGYERKYTKASFFTKLKVIPGRCLASLLSLATSVIDTFPYRIRNAILIKAPWYMGRAYLFIFNRKKYKEVSLSVQKFK